MGTRDVICDTGSLLLILPFRQDIKSHNQLANQEKGKGFLGQWALCYVCTKENIFGGILTFIIWEWGILNPPVPQGWWLDFNLA